MGKRPTIYALLAPHRPVEYKVSAKAWATSGAPATPHLFLALPRPAPAPRSALEHQPASNWIAGWAFTHTARPPAAALPPPPPHTPLAACPDRVTNSSCSHERVAVCHPGKPVLQERVGGHLAALRLWRAAAVQPLLGAGGGFWLLLPRQLWQAGATANDRQLGTNGNDKQLGDRTLHVKKPGGNKPCAPSPATPCFQYASAEADRAQARARGAIDNNLGACYQVPVR